MNNLISLFLNTLVRLGHLTKDDAAKLYDEFSHLNLPDDFEGSFQQVKSVFEKTDVSPSTKK
jgi:hypothetical protein